MLGKRLRWGALGAVLLALGLGAAPARAAVSDPLFVFFARENVLPGGDFEGPCGLAVDSAANFYVADYYHRAVDVYNSGHGYRTHLTGLDPLDGPCGLAVAPAGSLYVNDFHRNVQRFTPSTFPPGLPANSTTYAAGPVIDSAEPTGVAVDSASSNVYVDDRTYVAAYGPSGAPLLDGGGDPLRIGEGSLGDGYGIAVSRFPATAGRLYVPDAADNTVKVYDPALNTEDPVAVIDGSGVPGGHFVSLRDAAVAVDRVSGDVYVADDLQPAFYEHPEAAIYVFDSTGAYKGRLKYNIVDAQPPGLAVDNSTAASQGRVYVTSGNSEQASVYAYGPGAATSASFPAAFTLQVASIGDGGGAIASQLAGLDCATACAAQVRAGAEVPLVATPDSRSSFLGWSGGGCSGTGACTVEMSEATSVRAEFAPLPGAAGPAVETPGGSAAVAAASARPGAGAGASGIAQKGTLRVTVTGQLSPRSLPRAGAAPIAVSVGGKIATTDQSLPPQLEALRIELNRHGRLDYAGLPTCPYDRIQPASSARALAACRSALVGKGRFSANITLAGQEPYPTEGRLLVFNGRSHGKPVLFGQIYTPHPFANSFVIVFAVRKLAGGTYGTELHAFLPKALGNWGNLTGLEMTLSRRYSYSGERHSYISAGCPAPAGFTALTFPMARTSFVFGGGQRLTSVFISTCTVRR